MAIKRCKAAFSTFVGGAPRVIAAGQLLDEGDPVIKGREDLFESVEAHVAQRAAAVEQATAAPGEKRSITPAPARTAASSTGKARGKAKPSADDDA